MRPKLLALIAEETGQTTPIEGSEFLIGRLPICDLRIDDPAVSGRHCRIVCRGDRVEIEDLGSTNGTLVNDEQARHLALHDGDQIEVGPARFRIRIQTRTSEGHDDASWLGEVLDERVLPRVQHLHDEDELHPESPAVQAARAVLERLAGKPSAQEPEPKHAPGRALDRDPGIPSLSELVAQEQVEAAEPDTDTDSSIPLIDFPAGARSRLRFGDAAGVTLVHLSRSDLANDVEVATVSDQLEALIRAGRSRLALNCSRARHFSSQAIGTLVQAHKRCQAAGGQLKLCSLRPEADQLLELMGLKRLFAIYSDDAQALESPWPAAAQPQPSLAATLVLLGQQTATSGRTGGGRERAPGLSTDTADTAAERLATPSQTGLRVRLEVLVGRARRRWIEINRPHFEIGRDPSCQLRPDSPAISRRHTVIEQRGGRVFVRDLGTTNGTTVNGQCLRGTELEVHDGDRLQVGPLLFGFAIEALPSQAAGLEDEVARLLLGEGQAQADTPTVQLDATAVNAARAARAQPQATAHDPEALATAALQRPVARREVGPRVATECRVLGPPGHEVLIVAIPAGQLDGEDTVAPVRLDLQRCQEERLPNRVVLDLGRVTFLSSRAVGLLLTTFQQLNRDGGGLRLAAVRPEVLPTLEHMRVPRFLDLFPSVEAATQAGWDQ